MDDLYSKETLCSIMEAIKLLAISIGAVLGALLRYGLVLAFSSPGHNGIPYGVIVVNWLGSFLIAYLAFFLDARLDAPAWLAPLLIIGLLGSFTTFSTFSLDTFKLIQAGAISAALLYIFLSVCGGISLAFLGYWLASKAG